ncbi:MAG: hypothetical protein JWQ94_3744 [Tardiphaga sp.]|nr:hypothetical protein [Tardiphaga sp.]
MKKHPEDYDLAERCWAHLLVLRANPYPQAVPELRKMEDQLMIKSQGLESERKVRATRENAWLAVCRLLEEIETNPKDPAIAQLWLNAQDAMKTWQREAE